MEFSFQARPIRVFPISPRTLDKSLYWQNIVDVVSWSEKYDCTGVLLFTGNDTFVEPWAAASYIVANSNLSPLVAVNPVYMHPFTVAKFISTFAYVYNSKIYLNLVAGTAISHLVALGENAPKEERYERLLEFVQIVDDLLSESRTATVHGSFYDVENLQLPPGIDAELRPEYFLAGQSEGAQKCLDAINGVAMKMLQPDFSAQVGSDRGVHFGIVTRKTTGQAWDVANQYFPEDRVGQKILDKSMKNTDAAWKARMRMMADQPDIGDSGYWLGPFRNFQADCPYIVGNHDEIATVIAGLVSAGIDSFILDIPSDEKEFEEISTAFSLVHSKLS